MKTAGVLGMVVAALVTTTLSGCATGAFETQKVSVLDGTWAEHYAGCVNSEPTPEEQKINQAIKSGQVSTRLRVTGTTAEVEIITHTDPPAQTAGKTSKQAFSEDENYCRLVMNQRWNVIGDHVEVTDLKISQQGHGTNKCQGSPTVHDPRVHNYVLKGDRLMIYMNSIVSVTSLGDASAVMPSQCANGEPQTVVFRRLPN